MGSVFRILSIDGGGIRGVFPAQILQEIEEKLGVNLYESFDMITGTSTGAIIAAGVATKMPMRDIVDLYKKHGSTIFQREKPKFLFKKLRLKLQPILHSIYDAMHLKNVLQDVFQQQTLGNIEKPLILPATDIGNGSVHVFKSGYSKEFVRDKDVLVTDAVLASCSAPTFFNPHRLTPYLLADGGLWANNPSLVATIDACYRLNIKQENIRVVSIGTGHQNTMYGTDAFKKWGLFNGWGREKFIDFILSLQSQSTKNYLDLLLGREKILRLDFESDKPLPLDDVSVMDDLISRAGREFTYQSANIKYFLENQ